MLTIRRSRRLHFQPKQYESIDVGADIEFTEADVPTGMSLEDFADALLNRLLDDEMVEAAAATQNDSFIADYRTGDL